MFYREIEVEMSLMSIGNAEPICSRDRRAADGQEPYSCHSSHNIDWECYRSISKNRQKLQRYVLGVSLHLGAKSRKKDKVGREDWVVDTGGTLKKCCVINDNRGADFKERMICCVKYSQSCRSERAFGLLLYD